MQKGYASITGVADIEQKIFMQHRKDAKVANQIDSEMIDYVAILAQLELSEQEKQQAADDMNRMLDYIDQLNELDTTGIEPMSHVFPVENVFREDEVTNGDGQAQTLANAPKEKDDSFIVPTTIENSNS